MRTPSQHIAAFYPLSVVILVVGFLVRVLNNLRMPLYFDEVHYIERAQYVLTGSPFAGDMRKFGLYVYLALFNPTGPEAPWLVRMASAVASVAAIAGCMALAKAAAGKRAGLLAGIICSLLPFTVFHDRTVLAEPLQAALTICAIVLMVSIARRPRLWTAALMALLLGLSITVKITTLPYLALPLVAVLLLARGRRQMWQALALAVPATLIAFGLVAAVFIQAEQTLGGQVTFLSLFVRPVLNVLQSRSDEPVNWYLITSNARDYVRIMQVYAGWPFMILGALSAALAFIDTGWRRTLLFLMVPSWAMALVPILAQGADTLLIVPRYLVPTITPFVALVATSIVIVSEYAEEADPGMGLLGVVISTALVLLPAALFDARLIGDPASARLYPTDRVNFVSGWGSGVGMDTLAYDMLEMREQAGAPHIRVYGYDKYLVWMNAYLGPRIATIDYVDTSPSQRNDVARSLGRGELVFILGDNDEDLPRLNPNNTRPELIRAYQTSHSGPLFLFGVEEVYGATANAIYSEQVPDPDLMQADYTALAEALRQSAEQAGGDLAILVFPVNQEKYLEQIGGLPVTPISIETWPASQLDKEAALRSLALGASGDPVDVVIVDEAKANPDQTMVRALQSTYYRTGEEWFGLIHRISFVTGPDNPERKPVGSVFEHAITLEGASVLDQDARAGRAARIAVRWETAVPIGDSFQVFTHVVERASGTLQAQYDSVPGGGLYPMPSWKPGQPVDDQFAVRLPAWLPPGQYEVRMGIYHPASGLRLPVTNGPNEGGDYVVIGEIAIDG